MIGIGHPVSHKASLKSRKMQKGYETNSFKMERAALSEALS
jgi:hypothetical protein